VSTKPASIPASIPTSIDGVDDGITGDFDDGTTDYVDDGATGDFDDGINGEGDADFTSDGNVDDGLVNDSTEPPEDDEETNFIEADDGPADDEEDVDSESLDESENGESTSVSMSGQLPELEPETDDHHDMTEHDEYDATNHGGLTNLAELTDELIEERKVYLDERKKFLGKIITQAEQLLDKDDC